MKFIKSPTSLALISGLFLALAWPETGLFVGFAFFALVPLLFAEQKLREQNKPLYQVGLLAFLTFFIFNLISLRWLFLVSEPMTVRVVSVLFPPLVNGFLMALTFTLGSYVTRHVGKKEGLISFIIFWLGFEYVHFNWELNFPWLTFGNVFANNPELVLWYKWTGVQGGSLWIWLVNLGIFWLCANNRHKSLKQVGLIFAICMLPILVSFTVKRPESTNTLQVGVVQPNYDPYSAKFYTDPLLQVEEMLELSSQVNNAQVIVWPETALQERATVQRGINGVELYGLWEKKIDKSESVRLIKNWQKDSLNKASFIVGMSSRKWIENEKDRKYYSRPIPSLNAWYNNYNSALMIHDTLQLYYKNKLVAGVETFPYAGLLKPLESLIIDMGGTTGSLGRSEEPILMSDGISKAAPIICYESIFGEYVGTFVQKGANWLTVMTNDGWWGNGAGYKHHLAYARLLAISHQRWVVRSANTGISAFVDTQGNIVKQTDWWKAQSIQQNIELHHHLTFYTKHGDYLGRNAAFISILLWGMAFVRKRKNKVGL